MPAPIPAIAIPPIHGVSLSVTPCLQAILGLTNEYIHSVSGGTNNHTDDDKKSTQKCDIATTEDIRETSNKWAHSR